MKFDTKVSAEAAYLRNSSIERQHLFKLLEVYWGKGDGKPAPDFIQAAAALCGFPVDS